MGEKLQLVHVQFHAGVSSPMKVSAQEKSVYLDAFERDEKRARLMRLEKDGETIIATCIKSGRVKIYPWAAAREATYADDRYVNSDPRQALKPVEKSAEKPVEAPPAKGKVSA